MKKTRSEELFIEHKNGLINAELNDVPLGQILDKLKSETDLKINLSTNSIANSPVSLTVNDIPLKEAIQSILEGFSYALYSVENSFAVVVLSTGAETLRTHRIVISEPKRTGQAEDLTDATEAVEPNKLADSNPEETPESLDDFQVLTMEELPSGSAAEVQERADPSELLARKEEYEEAHDQLVGIDDPRVTATLVDATRTETDRIIRAQAVDALWRHVANLQFSDATSIDVLRRLAEDSDDRVRSIASQALRDMEHYGQDSFEE